MRTREDNNKYQLEWYYKNKEQILEKRRLNRDEYNQRTRSKYWEKKTGSKMNMAFIKYIQQLLREDKRMNQ